MSRHCCWLVVVASCFAFILGTSPPSRAAEFRPVVSVANGASGFDLSDNGRAIGGSIPSAAPGKYQPFRWTPETNLVWLPMPVTPEESYWLGCSTYALTADGAKVVMSCQFDEHHVWALLVNDVAPFVYESGAFTGWERSEDESYIYDVTPNGASGVGYSFEFEGVTMDHNYRAIRWDNGSQHQLDPLPGGNCDSFDDNDAEAVAISDDGSTVVGFSGDNQHDGYQRPAVWINDVVSRLDAFGPECGVPNSWLWGPLVAALSGNGLYAVGHWPAPGVNANAVYWHVPTRTQTILPRLNPLHTSARALCVSRMGDWIGGQSCGADGCHGVLWDRSTGTPHDVEELLTVAGVGLDLTGWKIYSVADISANGKQVVGGAVHPNGESWLWWADLTNPPKNDTCANAALLPSNTSPYVLDTRSHTIAGTTTRDATWDGGASCASAAHENTNIWYRFTAPVDGYLMLDLCGSPPGLLDAYMSVHTSCPGTAANESLCMTDCPHRRDCGWPCIQPQELFIGAGQTRYIQIGGWSDEGHDLTLTYRFLPLNDDCADAFSVGHNPSSTPGSTLGMSPDAAGSCHDVNDTAPGVWYTVLGTGTIMTAATCGEGGDANFDTHISVFCGGCGGQTCVAANDDSEECAGSTTRHSSVSWCSSPGALYHILVHGYGDDSGIFDLAVTDDGVSCLIAINCHPANEECEQAIDVSNETLMSDNTGANTSSITTLCGATTNDVWFHYRTRCDGELWADTCQLGLGSMDDSVVSLYAGCSGEELDCNDDYSDLTIDCQHRSAAIGSVYQDQDILIRVAGFGSHQLNQGTFPLRVTEVAAPLVLISFPTLPDGNLGDDYAYQLAYYGSCGRRFVSATGLPPGLSCENTGLISGTPKSAGDFAIHVEVCNNDILEPECTEGEFTLRIWPSNDACADAIAVSEGLHYFGNAGATTDGPTEAICEYGGDSQVGSDVWYEYTSSCIGEATVDLCDSGFDTKVAVYSGARCRTLDGAVACNDDWCGLQSLVRWPVQPGDKYVIRIGGYHGEQGNGRMLISCINDCNDNAVSDAEELAGGAESDCNYNARPDSCDSRGDFNADGLLDLADWPVCLSCFWGPCGPGFCSAGNFAEPCCAWIDFDDDGDIDLKDLSILQYSYSQ